MYFHLEKCKKDLIKEFIPKIPSSILPDENNQIKRICVSSSIEGAIGSVPWGGYGVQYMGAKVPIRVYEFRDDSNIKILNQFDLIKKKYVQDAICYDEHWFLDNICPSNVYYILINDYLEVQEEYFQPEFYDLIKNGYSDKFEDYYIATAPVFKRLNYEVIKDEDIILGNEFIINITEIKELLVSYKNIEEKIAYLMNDYKSNNNTVQSVILSDNKLIIKTEFEEGLYLKDFLLSLPHSLEKINF